MIRTEEYKPYAEATTCICAKPLRVILPVYRPQKVHVNKRAVLDSLWFMFPVTRLFRPTGALSKHLRAAFAAGSIIEPDHGPC
jgi:hypothetical protein